MGTLTTPVSGSRPSLTVLSLHPPFSSPYQPRTRISNKPALETRLYPSNDSRPLPLLLLPPPFPPSLFGSFRQDGRKLESCPTDPSGELDGGATCALTVELPAKGLKKWWTRAGNKPIDMRMMSVATATQLRDRAFPMDWIHCWSIIVNRSKRFFHSHRS